MLNNSVNSTSPQKNFSLLANFFIHCKSLLETLILILCGLYESKKLFVQRLKKIQSIIKEIKPDLFTSEFEEEFKQRIKEDLIKNYSSTNKKLSAEEINAEINEYVKILKYLLLIGVINELKIGVSTPENYPPKKKFSDKEWNDQVKLKEQTKQLLESAKNKDDDQSATQIKNIFSKNCTPGVRNSFIIVQVLFFSTITLNYLIYSQILTTNYLLFNYFPIFALPQFLSLLQTTFRLSLAYFDIKSENNGVFKFNINNLKKSVLLLTDFSSKLLSVFFYGSLFVEIIQLINSCLQSLNVFYRIYFLWGIKNNLIQHREEGEAFKRSLQESIESSRNNDWLEMHKFNEYISILGHDCYKYKKTNFYLYLFGMVASIVFTLTNHSIFFKDFTYLPLFNFILGLVSMCTTYGVLYLTITHKYEVQ